MIQKHIPDSLRHTNIVIIVSGLDGATRARLIVHNATLAMSDNFNTSDSDNYSANDCDNFSTIDSDKFSASN